MLPKEVGWQEVLPIRNRTLCEGNAMMMEHMEGMGWMMGAMGLLWILILVFLVLGIAAFIKYLRSGR